MTKNLPYDRTKRVADRIHQVVSTAVLMEISDPRIAGLTITRVKMTRDLRTVYIYYHVAEGAKADCEKFKESLASAKADREKFEEGLASAKGFIKKRVSDEIDLRYVPEMQFFYDDSVDLREKIESLFRGEDSRG